MNSPLFSSEIRWFSQEKHFLHQIFTEISGTGWQEPDRIDYYLRYQGIDTGIKIREGKHEIKVRNADNKLLQNGVVEHWTKWSTKEEKNVLNTIASGQMSQWLPVKKERAKKKFVWNKSTGQMEYTEGFADDGYQTFYFNLVFLLLSYVIGQVLFQVGGAMDKLSYDKFSKIIFKKDYNLSVIKSTREKLFRTFDESLDSRGTNQFEFHMNNFQWALSYLRHHDNDAFQEVEKIMADSKFFRSILAATILYLLYYSIIHLPYLGSFIIIFSSVIYVSIYFYEDSIQYLDVDSRLRKNKNDIEKINKTFKERKEALRKGWFWSGLGLFLFCLAAFLFHGYNGGGKMWVKATQSIFLEYKFNLLITLTSLVSLLLYFRTRKKSIKKAYQVVVYNLKMKIT